jgi:hypothetical protein
MKQTAVEFLEKELNQLLVLFSTKWEQVNTAIEQAKEMEKQQIIDAYETGDKYKTEIPGQQYYNETFNK